ncbi:GFA family protein [Litoribacillus peritrichatus]|uniref:GFA family protein n=1 Tax=Litoribacillus peritrichatus TaxID=718191 RepID=A0ABP7MRD4_9GAMM
MESSGIHKGSCHCGAVEFTVNLPNGIEGPYRCNCSLCDRRGAIAAPVQMEEFKVTKGEEFLTLYQFNTQVAKHYFCAQCGIYTHHQRRSNPSQFSYNVACLEGINSQDIECVGFIDGVNHAMDQ